MKSLLIIVAVCIFSYTAVSQSAQNGVETKITKINALYPSFEQEFRVSPQTTWGYRAGLNTFLEYGNSRYYSLYDNHTQTKTRYFEFIPTAEIYYRWYYRILKRQEKGKKTINNSSGYFFAGAEIMTPGIKVQTVNNEGLNEVLSGVYAGWGFRKTFGSRVAFDFNIRYAVLMQNVDKVDFTNIIPGIRLGYILNKK
ncbi:hypothetical protein SAMN05444274_10423 [Mariniphaga anaerophila]|uniref:Outer membrane protein beta-barrel domain-containing protein n=1 Tax=Mariniphaga anaerophila TaxID=1484053 RepID=A0A1M4ZRD9_9BACT|nr:hypothetical protein [Mariniphaga anaerophila]SHF20136.1 hypothetical protein SAMN05444274_10423 [Mariniphaga anaerophila]